MMPDYNAQAGRLLRRLRKGRNLILRDAARRLNMSAPALSRKERGQERIERRDIAEAVRGYELSPWEAYTLWTSAGFIPEPTVPPQREYDLRTFAETLFPSLPFPAFIMDVLGYVVAWNEGIEMIWRPSQAGPGRIHLIEDLFSPRLRERLGERWEPYVRQSLAVFYHKTLPVANDPEFLALIDRLARTYREDFTRLWGAARQNSDASLPLPPIDMGTAVVSYDSALGMIEYLVLQSVVQFPQTYELIVYMPYGDANNERYRLLRERMPQNRAYVRL